LPKIFKAKFQKAVTQFLHIVAISNVISVVHFNFRVWAATCGPGCRSSV